MADMLYILIVPFVIIIFIAVILARALAFRPPPAEQVSVEDVPVDAMEVAERLARMIRCKTVSSRKAELVDKAEFEKFLDLLPELYPCVHKACVVERIASSGILYTLKGRSSAAPVVFMSHYDVVPADEPAWEKPAFAGIIELAGETAANGAGVGTGVAGGTGGTSGAGVGTGGADVAANGAGVGTGAAESVLWGRGTLDTKSTLCGIMEAAERLLLEGFVPEHDLYFAFSGDEETGGETAPAMVAELKKRGITPAMVLDEGGAVAEGVFPGVSQQCALIGTSEKGMLDIELVLETSGGHASTPPPSTPVGILARAVTRIERKPFKARLAPPVAGMFNTLGRHSTFLYRVIFANLWCFMPALDRSCRKNGGQINAMLRTTCAFTMMEGSNASNVLPPLAKVGANLRIISGETTDMAVGRLRAVAGDPRIAFKTVYSTNPSPNSHADGAGWDALRDAVRQTWPDALVSPYMMYACTDSRHYCSISERVYRFSAMKLSQDEFKMIHGNNERIPLDTLAKIVQFYIRLMRRC